MVQRRRFCQRAGDRARAFPRGAATAGARAAPIARRDTVASEGYHHATTRGGAIAGRDPAEGEWRHHAAKGRRAANSGLIRFSDGPPGPRQIRAALALSASLVLDRDEMRSSGTRAQGAPTP